MTKRRKPVRGSQAYARANGLREVVSIRMTREQIDALDAAAKAAGLSRAEWIIKTAGSCGTCERCLAGNRHKCFSLPCAGCGEIGICSCHAKE